MKKLQKTGEFLSQNISVVRKAKRISYGPANSAHHTNHCSKKKSQCLPLNTTPSSNHSKSTCRVWVVLTFNTTIKVKSAAFRRRKVCLPPCRSPALFNLSANRQTINMHSCNRSKVLASCLWPLALLLGLSACPVLADNYEYCYDRDKGLDEECLERKNYHTERYRQRRQRERGQYYAPQPVNPNPWNIGGNGRFQPTPIPERIPLLMPGMQ